MVEIKGPATSMEAKTWGEVGGSFDRMSPKSTSTYLTYEMNNLDIPRTSGRFLKVHNGIIHVRKPQVIGSTLTVVTPLESKPIF